MGYLKRTWAALVAKVDIPKPTAWPPPKDEQRVTELLEYGYKRDPVGDKIHTAFACLFMFALPLTTASVSISMALLLGYSLLRLPTTWRTLTPLLRSKIFILLVGWCAWSILSIAWSPATTVGLDMLKPLRMVFLIPILWPIMKHWKYLLLAFLTGVFLQNLVQISEVIGSLFLNGIDWKTGNRLSALVGLGSHTGKNALFMAFAVILWVGIAFEHRQHRPLAIFSALLAFGGMLATVSMAVSVGFFIASLFSCLYIVACRLVSKKQLLYILLIATLAAGSTTLLVRGRFVEKYDSATQGVKEFLEGSVDETSSTQLRLHWWTRSLQEMSTNSGVTTWLIGNGIGSVSEIDFSKEGTEVFETSEHVHNSYIQILYEEGIFGLLLFLGFIASMAKQSFAPSSQVGWCLAPISIAGVLIWSVTTFFENSQSSGRPFAMVVLLALFMMYLNNYSPKVKQA